MRLLVTGGCGFIGGAFVDHMLALGHEIIDIDKLTYAADPDRHRNHPKYERIIADVAKPGVTRFDADAIVHFAAESHVDNSLAKPTVSVETNVLGTLNMLELTRRLQCRFVHISTDEVTGDIEDGPPTNEASPIRVSSPYSASKAGAELLALAYERSYDLDVTVVRMTNVFGPGQCPEKFIPRAITYALSGRTIPVYRPGNQVRDWLFVKDAVRGIAKVLDFGISGNVYCLGACNERKNLDVAVAIGDLLNAHVTYVQDRPGHDTRYATDPTQTERELDWAAEVEFEAGLNETILWYKENEAWWRKMIAREGCRWD